MFFGRNNRRREEPVARPVVTPLDKARGIVSVSNGPDTPIMDVSAMRKALNHAAWRDPWVDRRKGDVIQSAVRTLERTAACVDLAAERLAEARETLTQGKEATDRMMRGLLTARFEELLDSLERVITLAQDGKVNLLSGVPNSLGQASGSYKNTIPDNALSLDLGSAGFSYVLTPIDIGRGAAGFGIGTLVNGFESDEETYAIETALLKGQAKLAQFADRLSHDATMLVRIAQEFENAQAAHNTADQARVAANMATSPDAPVEIQTESEDVA